MASLSPYRAQFFDDSGNPLSGGKVCFYASGTTTPQNTYTDQSGSTPNANPVILNARGEASIWMDSLSYKVVLKTANDVTIWTEDNIQPSSYSTVNKTSTTGSAILPSGTTAERDGSPVSGYLRFNSTTQALESWFSAAWQTIATAATAVLVTGAQSIAGVKTFLDGIEISSTKKINCLGTSAALQIAGTDAVPFNAGGVTSKLQSVACTQNAGALTFTLNPCVLDFRSTTLTTGVPVTRLINSALSLVLPSGGTLGAVTTVSAQLILVAIDNAGTPELAVVNIAGGNDLSETGIINTTAISAASTANNVFYSTTARTGVAYRVVGHVDAVNTAGSWGNPTLVQGYGGQALAAMSSLGYGQTPQSLTGSRVIGTTYYNTTGKPIIVSILATGAATSAYGALSINGTAFSYTSTAFAASAGVMLPPTVIPQNASYVLNNSFSSLTISNWYELR